MLIEHNKGKLNVNENKQEANNRLNLYLTGHIDMVQFPNMDTWLNNRRQKCQDIVALMSIQNVQYINGLYFSTIHD